MLNCININNAFNKIMIKIYNNIQEKKTILCILPFFMYLIKNLIIYYLIISAVILFMYILKYIFVYVYVCITDNIIIVCKNYEKYDNCNTKLIFLLIINFVYVYECMLILIFYNFLKKKNEIKFIDIIEFALSRFFIYTIGMPILIYLQISEYIKILYITFDTYKVKKINFSIIIYDIYLNIKTFLITKNLNLFAELKDKKIIITKNNIWANNNAKKFADMLLYAKYGNKDISLIYKELATMYNHIFHAAEIDLKQISKGKIIGHTDTTKIEIRLDADVIQTNYKYKINNTKNQYSVETAYSIDELENMSLHQYKNHRNFSASQLNDALFIAKIENEKLVRNIINSNEEHLILHQNRNSTIKELSTYYDLKQHLAKQQRVFIEEIVPAHLLGEEKMMHCFMTENEMQTDVNTIMQFRQQVNNHIYDITTTCITTNSMQEALTRGKTYFEIEETSGNKGYFDYFINKITNV